MRRRSNLDFERRRRSRRSSYRRRQAKKKLLGKLPKEKKKIHLNLEKIVSGISWVFKIAVTCLIAFVAVWYWGQQVSTVGDSMRPVLKNADKVLVNRIVYNASSPNRGDIIDNAVFRFLLTLRYLRCRTRPVSRACWAESITIT